MSITFYTSGSMLNKAFGVVDFSYPSSYFVGLSKTTISTSGSNVSEPITGSYARVEVENTKSNFTYAVSGSLLNAVDIVFPESTAAWGTITDIAFFDSASSGNVWFYQALTNPRTIDINTIITFSASAIAISMTN